VRQGKLLTAAAVGLVVLCAAPLHSQALEEVDRAVSELGRFVLRFVPDRQGLKVAVLPFVSDRDGRVLLGDRLRGELELFLAAELAQTRAAPQAGGENTYTVSGELQVYPTVIRLLCRVHDPGGSLVGGTRVDLRSSPELAALLVSPSGDLRPPSGDLRPPSGDLRPAPAGLTSPSGQLRAPAGSPGAPDGSGRPNAEPDPFEPDDQPGFEVEVPPEGTASSPYARYLAPGDIDRFRFYVSREGPVTLEVRTAVDLQLLLYREGESLPFEVAAGRRGDSLRVERTLAEGYYIVELLAFDVNIQGQYSLSLALSGTADDSFEPDNAPEQAAVLAPDTRQERVLRPGDTDWVELAADKPGFYALYTTGDKVDTAITLFADNNRELLADEGSGGGLNAFVALFLGVRRTYARISATDPRQGGPYRLVFERVEPRQVYPDASQQTIELGSKPEVLQLRVFQSGRYLVAARNAGAGAGAGAPGVKVFSLPAMRLVKPSDTEALCSLSAGDYLVLISGERSGVIRLCVASESQAEVCRQRLAE
jgi:hypothetical protein